MRQWSILWWFMCYSTSCYLPAFPGHVLSHPFPWSLVSQNSFNIPLPAPPHNHSWHPFPVGALTQVQEVGHVCLAVSQAGHSSSHPCCRLAWIWHDRQRPCLNEGELLVHSWSRCRAHPSAEVLVHLGVESLYCDWNIGTVGKGNIWLSQSLALWLGHSTSLWQLVGRHIPATGKLCMCPKS